MTKRKWRRLRGKIIAQEGWKWLKLLPYSKGKSEYILDFFERIGVPRG